MLFIILMLSFRYIWNSSELICWSLQRKCVLSNHHGPYDVWRWFLHKSCTIHMWSEKSKSTNYRSILQIVMLVNIEWVSVCKSYFFIFLIFLGSLKLFKLSIFFNFFLSKESLDRINIYCSFCWKIVTVIVIFIVLIIDIIINLFDVV